MAKVGTKVAKRYALALFRSSNIADVESVRDALRSVAGAWQESKELRDTLKNPAVSVADKVAVVRAIASKVRSNDEQFSNFVSLLAQNQRLVSLPQISQIFSSLVDEAKRLLALEIASAFDVPTEERRALQSRVESDFGSMASISWQVDPDLIGGLLIKAGDKLLDSSIRGSLERIEAQLTGVRA